MPKKQVVDLETVTPAEQIIDILKGKAQFYISNPYFAPECITKLSPENYFKTKSRKGFTMLELELPDIYIRYSELAWTKDFIFQYGSKTKKINYKILPPFDKDKKLPESFAKAKQQLLVQLGTATPEGKNIALVEWQICQAYEFAIYSRIFDIDFSNCQTDKDFINKVEENLKPNEDLTEYFDKYIEIIKTKALKIKLSKPKNAKQTDEENEEDEDEDVNCYDFGAITRYAFENYIRANAKTLDKKNPCLLYFFKNKTIKSIEIKPKFTITQLQTPEENKVLKPVEIMNFKGKFVVLFNEEKQQKMASFITQCSNPAVKKGPHQMTIKDFQFADKPKFSGMFVISLHPICHIYNVNDNGIVRTETLEWEINQISMGKFVGTSSTVDLLIEDDDEADTAAIEDANNQGENDAEAMGLC